MGTEKKKPAKRRARAAKKHAARPARKAPTIRLALPNVRINDERIGLSSAAQLALHELGTKPHGKNVPSFVRDPEIWKRAKRDVSRHWKRFAYPFAVVTFVYQRMGGRMGSAR